MGALFTRLSSGAYTIPLQLRPAERESSYRPFGRAADGGRGSPTPSEESGERRGLLSSRRRRELQRDISTSINDDGPHDVCDMMFSALLISLIVMQNKYLYVKALET